jgi:hypothetical protein
LSYGIGIDEDDTPDDIGGRVQRYQKYAENSEENAEWAEERARNANTRRQLNMAEATAEKNIDAARYWNNRIAGAISLSAYKDKPDVIVRRIKKLQAAERKQTWIKDESGRWLDRWQNIPLKLKSGGFATMQQSAEFLADYDSGPIGIWSALNDEKMTPEEAQAQSVKAFGEKITHAERWLAHLARRIAYETAYLESVGGSADMLKPKPRRKSIAPDDGFKKGDTAYFTFGMKGYVKGEILRLHAKTARMKFIDREEMNEKYPKGYKAGRIFLKTEEEMKKIENERPPRYNYS